MDSFLLVEICIALILGYFGYHIFRICQIRSQLKWVKNVAPGWPIFGCVFEFGGSETFLPILLKFSNNLNGFFIAKFMHRTFIITSNHKFLEFVLTSHKILDKPREYKYLERWLETGLLTAGVKKWHRTRKMLTPAFHFSILEKFVDVFDSNSDVLIRKLENVVGKDSVDIYPYIKMLALDTICESSLGVQINAQDNQNEDYTFAVSEMCRIIIERSFSVFNSFDLFYKLTREYQKEKKYIEILHSYSQSVIKKRKLEISKNRNEKVEENDIGTKKRTAFLDLLLQSQMNGSGLTDDEIRQEVDTFMFAGHDTITSAISFVLYNLARYPDIQQKAYEEQKILLETSTDSKHTGYQHFKEMKYLENVIKETLRLYPSVPFYTRDVTEDVHFDGNVVPKGTSIFIFAYGAGRNPEMFKDPEVFNPDRFNEDNRLPFSFIPFSAGPRNCLGQKYAMLEMKVIIGKILRHYKLLPAIPNDEMVLVAETVLKSINGVPIRLAKRDTM